MNKKNIPAAAAMMIRRRGGRRKRRFTANIFAHVNLTNWDDL